MDFPYWCPGCKQDNNLPGITDQISSTIKFKVEISFGTSVNAVKSSAMTGFCDLTSSKTCQRQKDYYKNIE